LTVSVNFLKLQDSMMLYSSITVCCYSVVFGHLVDGFQHREWWLDMAESNAVIILICDVV